MSTMPKNVRSVNKYMPFVAVLQAKNRKTDKPIQKIPIEMSAIPLSTPPTVKAVIEVTMAHGHAISAAAKPAQRAARSDQSTTKSARHMAPAAIKRGIQRGAPRMINVFFSM